MKRLEPVRDVCGLLGLLVIVGWLVGADEGVGQVLFVVGWICAGLGGAIGLALYWQQRRTSRGAG